MSTLVAGAKEGVAMPHQAARIASVIAACIALILVWVAAILVARSLLGAHGHRRASDAARIHSQEPGGNSRGGAAERKGPAPVLDHSLSIRQSDPYAQRQEWSTKRQE